MTPPLPQNAAALLDAKISALEDRSGRFVAKNGPEIRALLADAERLARVDAANASTLKGRIFALAGDRAQTAKLVLDDVGTTQEQAQAALDVAGGLLREQKLLWLRDAPRLFAHRSSEDRGVLFEFQLAVDPSEAASLSSTLIDRLVAKDLDLPCLSIAFIGMGAPPPSSTRVATPLQQVP